jgi:predicted dehydrogenase
MRKVKVGFVGAGVRANVAHYPSLAEMEDVEIAAICDLRRDRLEATAEKYGVKNRFTDYKLMLKKMDLDAVYVIMFPDLLDPIVTDCLEEGLNVFIEKPPGMTLEETKRWASLARRNGCKTMVGFQRRFHPCVVHAKKILSERGRILYCAGTFHKHGEWAGYLGKFGGISLVLDVIHIVDLIRWIGGEVKAVHSLTGQIYSQVEDHMNFYTAIFEFESGGVGILNSNRTAGGRVLRFEAHSKGISAYGDIPGFRGIDRLMILRDNQPYQTAEIIRNEELIEPDAPDTHYDGTFQMNRHFIDCIKMDKQPVANFEDAAGTMEVIEKIKEGPRLS